MAKKIKLKPEQQIAVDAARMASDWWRTEGQYLDFNPEMDLDWYEKRSDLAKLAYISGYKAAKQ